MNIKVSIIVPIYNVERYLDKCLESIVQQTYRNIEVLLIDDGSTDRSVEICDYYDNKYDYVKCFHLINKGVSNARNFGISKASGKYIICVDSDDYLEKNMIQIMEEQIRKSNAEIAISAINLFNTAYMGEKRNRIQSFVDSNKVINREELYSLIAENPLEPYFGAPYNKLIKKSFIIDNGFIYEEGAIIAEDTCFNYLMFAKCSKVVFCKEVLYHHRLNAGVSLSRRKHTIKNISDRIIELKRVVNIFEQSIDSEKETLKLKYLSAINTFYVHKVALDCIDLKKLDRAKKIAAIIKQDNMYNGKFKFFLDRKMYFTFVTMCEIYRFGSSVIKKVLCLMWRKEH